MRSSNAFGRMLVYEGPTLAGRSDLMCPVADILGSRHWLRRDPGVERSSPSGGGVVATAQPRARKEERPPDSLAAVPDFSSTLGLESRLDAARSALDRSALDLAT